MLGCFSTISTLNPASAISSAVCIPAIPPPITNALFSTPLSPDTNGALRIAFATAAFTSAIAFSVPCSLSLCTHEQCSLIFAISTRYGFNPAFAAALRNVVSCILGEHEATTTLSRLCSFIASFNKFCPISEHIY